MKLNNSYYFLIIPLLQSSHLLQLPWILSDTLTTMAARFTQNLKYRLLYSEESHRSSLGQNSGKGNSRNNELLMAREIIPSTGHAKGPGKNIILFFDASYSLKSCPIHWSFKESPFQTYFRGEDRQAGQQFLKNNNKKS